MNSRLNYLKNSPCARVSNISFSKAVGHCTSLSKLLNLRQLTRIHSKRTVNVLMTEMTSAIDGEHSLSISAGSC